VGLVIADQQVPDANDASLFCAIESAAQSAIFGHLKQSPALALEAVKHLSRRRRDRRGGWTA
jgi:hypothetical protein